MSDQTLIICLPTTIKTPVPKSRQCQCSFCDCGVWVAPSTIKDMPGLKGELVLSCVTCSEKIRLNSQAGNIPIDYIGITETQREELINAGCL